MRWALSTISGDGTAKIIQGQEDTTGPYRAKISDYGNHATLILSNSDGTPIKNWSLVYFNGDIVSAEADNAVRVLPDLNLDHVLTVNQANTVKTYLTNFGIDSNIVNAGMTVRQALRAIAREIDVTWDDIRPFYVA